MGDRPGLTGTYPYGGVTATATRLRSVLWPRDFEIFENEVSDICEQLGQRRTRPQEDRV